MRRDPLTTPPLPWRVGELARRTGLSVRTLHHWGDLALLVPSHRSAAGHRLYTAADIAHLQQIVALRGLGLALTEIRAVLADSKTTPAAVLGRRLERCRSQLALEQELCTRLERAAAAMDGDGDGADPPVDQTVQTIEVMTMIDRHYSPEQREQLARRRDELGEKGIQEAQSDWAALIDDVRTALAHGTDPRSTAGKRLAERWNGLVGEITGGDPGIERSLRTIYEEEPQAATTPIGADHREVYGFISRATPQAGD